MSTPRMPKTLRAWLLATRVLSYPIRWISQYFHSRMGADPARFGERLGQPRGETAGPVIWIHAASLGEVAQISALVRQLGQSGTPILVTTTTQAGADWVERELPEAKHQFAPMDTPLAVKRFLDVWHIKVAIFIEGDFGPRMSLEAQKRGIPQVLLNARYSRTRERFPSVFAALLGRFSLITCRSEEVAVGIQALGVPSERVKVLPDLRIATANLPCPAGILSELSAQIGSRPVWLAASTHPTDEGPVLEAHKALTAAFPDALLLLAPRHPRRGDALELAAKEHGFNVARRSADEVLHADTQVYLADTLGELGVFFTLSPLAFIGGSFGDEGGHNPYEPASFGKAILSGANVKNFADAYAALSEIGAAEILRDPGELGRRIVALIGSDQVHAMGNAGLQFMEASKNSVSETVALLEEVMRSSD